MATEKMSATVEAELLAEVRSVAGRRGFSAFVDRALRTELARTRFVSLLDELESEIGSPDPATMAWARQELDRADSPKPHGTRRARR